MNEDQVRLVLELVRQEIAQEGGGNFDRAYAEELQLIEKLLEQQLIKLQVAAFRRRKERS